MGAGLILFIICMSITFSIIVSHPFIKKITNKRLFWIILGLIYFTYLVYGRYRYTFVSVWELFVSSDNRGENASTGLLLNLCPFISFVLPISIIVDPTRKSSAAFAPLAILGGMINITGLAFSNVRDVELTLSYIFLGDDGKGLYWMMHALQVIIGTLVLLNSKRRWLFDLRNCTITFGVYITYVTIMVFIFNVKVGACGVVPNDWKEGGEFYAFAVVFNVGFPWIMFIGYSLSAVAVALLLIGLQLLQKIKCFSIQNKTNKTASDTNANISPKSKIHL